MSRERDPRIAKAFIAMKGLGIDADTVKPVLKRLLRLYDKKWELIEDDNYRTLADAIFEAMEDKVNSEKNGVVIHDDAEPPPKKHHRAVPEDQNSSIMDNGILLDMEEGELPQNSSEPKPMVSLEHVSGAPNIEPDYRSPSIPPLDKRKDPNFKHLSPREEHLTMVGASNASLQDHELHENGHDEKMREPEAEHPIDPLTNSSIPKSSVYIDKQKKKASSTPWPCFESTFDIASSACGRVKISLKCNHASGKCSSQSLNLDSVLKFVESKNMKSCQILGPDFSLLKVLREFCESCVELTADSDNNKHLHKLPGEYRNPMVQHMEPLRVKHCDNDLKKRSSAALGSSNASQVANQQPIYHGRRRPFHTISDITNGTEKVNISLIDEIGGEGLPNFVYIANNIVYQSAYVHVSLARIADEDCCPSCRGDCLSSVVPCACACETGGEFAYTTGGLLRDEFLNSCLSMNKEPHKHYNVYCKDCPYERANNSYRPGKCKGHLLRKFIKECWRKCGCNMLCGNRVVQRGISHKLQVFLTSENKGWGLRTLEELPKGAFVCEYVGEILTNTELYERNKLNSKDRHTYPVLLDADWGSEVVLKDEEALCLDATRYGNVARFINHRCYDANLLEIPVEVENPDHHYYHLAFFTKRKVDALEELTWDYGIDFADYNHPIKAFNCCCGSELCRDKKAKGVKPNISQLRPPSTGKIVKSSIS